MSRSTDYPAPLGRPVNITAARVTGAGEHYDPKIDECHLLWDAPPPTLPVALSSFNHIGERQDRLVVIGLYDQPERSGSRWLARCDCGQYCVVRGKSWRKWKGKSGKSCPRCDAIQHRKSGYDHAVRTAAGSGIAVTPEDAQS